MRRIWAAPRSRGFSVSSRREPKDLHAAWASLAAYDSKASGRALNRQAEDAKEQLRSVGYQLRTQYLVDGGKAKSFDGKFDVDETDGAYFWFRDTDRRGILAFRGSDTQEDLEHVRSTETRYMYGHHLHAAVAEDEFAPLEQKMNHADFVDCDSLVVTGHSLGGGCASLFAVLMNDTADPLGFGDDRKIVDELYGFGATAIFHNSETETRIEYGCGRSGCGFKGAIYRALRTVDGVEVQDRALNLATLDFHYPKTHLVSLRSPEVAPVAYTSSKTKDAPRWRAMVQQTPVDEVLFPLHHPANYVNWLGTQKKRVVLMAG